MKIVVAFLSIICLFQKINESPIIGTWNTQEDNTRIQIVEEKGVLVGRIISSDNKKAQVDKVILKGLIKSGNGWTGKNFAVKRNEWYDVEIISKKNILNLKIQVGIVHKNLIWERLY